MVEIHRALSDGLVETGVTMSCWGQQLLVREIVSKEGKAIGKNGEKVPEG